MTIRIGRLGVSSWAHFTWRPFVSVRGWFYWLGLVAGKDLPR